MRDVQFDKAQVVKYLAWTFALAYAIEQDADIVNMSFGSPATDNPFAKYTRLAVFIYCYYGIYLTTKHEKKKGVIFGNKGQKSHRFFLQEGYNCLNQRQWCESRKKKQESTPFLAKWV